MPCWKRLDGTRRAIQHLILVTQQPDFVLPATACVILDRMGLSCDTSAFDINQGCGGYPYGIWVAGRLLGPGERALLLVGDVSRFVSPEDRSTAALFGDCGSATLLEQASDAPPIAFTCGTDGSGFANIIVPSFLSCSRAGLPGEGQHFLPCPPGRLSMNGPEVFSFALQRVPGLVNRCLQVAGWDSSDFDDLVFHQANGLMLKMLADKLNLPAERVPTCLEAFGNTTSASIPLTLVSQRKSELREQTRHYVLAGFGVGWTWAGPALELGPLSVPDIVELG